MGRIEILAQGLEAACREPPILLYALEENAVPTLGLRLVQRLIGELHRALRGSSQGELVDSAKIEALLVRTIAPH